jgi:GNAT superfamily N-acetyltransferase
MGESLNITIDKPKVKDREVLHSFFEEALIDTFTKEGIGEMVQELENEIYEKKTFLEEYYITNGEKRFFLVAWVNNEIVGTIAYGPSNDIITQNLKGSGNEIGEVGTLLVKPIYQNQGIGSKLLQGIFKYLKDRNIDEVSLDSGYKRAQQIWIKKFGEPRIILKDFWGMGFDHMIWVQKVEKISYK